MIKNIVKLVLWLILLIGVLLVFDARKIVKNYFSTGSLNKTVNLLKIVGTLVCLTDLGIFVMYY